MTQVRFKQAVHLCGKDYYPGVHTIPDKVLNDKFFLRLVNSGHICDVDDFSVKIESAIERNQRLAQSLTAPKQKPETASPENQSPKTVDVSTAMTGEKPSKLEIAEEVSPPVSDESSEEKEQSSKIKKSNKSRR